MLITYHLHNSKSVQTAIKKQDTKEARQIEKNISSIFKLDDLLYT